jgi:3-oxoacyl-[acyl-carrier-protein] synthase II
MNLSSACATGLQSVMAGAEWVREGRCDFVLAGAAESSLHPLFTSAFEQLGVLSNSGRPRPFDKGRDGFLMGEGAAVFLLESRASAVRRDAKIYGTLLGWDFACDAHHATRFNSNGARIAGSLERALARAGVSAGDVGYVNAHGTGTALNDRLEALALTAVFGGRGAAVSSTKAATGHLLGAAGAVELAFTFLALRDGILPPTLNLSDPETADLDFIPETSRARAVRAAAALSFGFGGSIAAAVVGK